MNATEYATFYALVALVIFFALIIYLGVHKQILAALDKRGARISAELAEAVRIREEAQALLADYARKSQEADAEAQAIIASAKAEALHLTAETTKSLEDLIARRTKTAEAKIAQAEAQAIAAVRARAADVAIAAAETVLKQKTTGDVASDLMSRSIADVGAKLN
jgi:F-type H+-transporting ATPase subunit b